MLRLECLCINLQFIREQSLKSINFGPTVKVATSRERVDSIKPESNKFRKDFKSNNNKEERNAYSEEFPESKISFKCAQSHFGHDMWHLT